MLYVYIYTARAARVVISVRINHAEDGCVRASCGETARPVVLLNLCMLTFSLRVNRCSRER